jgi:hypothetical protein
VGLGREPLRLLSDELSKAAAGPAPLPVELDDPSRPGDTDLYIERLSVRTIGAASKLGPSRR